MENVTRHSTDGLFEDVSQFSIIFPSVLVPSVLILLLCGFCYCLHRKSPDIRQSTKRQTYLDFSKVDDSAMLRMSGEILENDLDKRSDDKGSDDTEQRQMCTTNNDVTSEDFFTKINGNIDAEVIPLQEFTKNDKEPS